MNNAQTGLSNAFENSFTAMFSLQIYHTDLSTYKPYCQCLAELVEKTA